MLKLSAMNAKDFLKEYGTEKASAVAKKAGTSLGYIQCIAYKNRRPSPELAMRLEKASKGIIKRADLRPDIWGPAA